MRFRSVFRARIVAWPVLLPLILAASSMAWSQPIPAPVGPSLPPANAARGSNPSASFPICDVPGTQSAVQCVTDGAGGAILTWLDGRGDGAQHTSGAVTAAGGIGAAG